MQPPAKAASGDQAGLVARSGQSFEHVTVPKDFAEIKSNPEAFFGRLKEHLARYKGPTKKKGNKGHKGNAP
jgi:hypothetical protein